MQGRWWDNEAALDALDLVDGSDPALGVAVAVLGFHAIAKQALAPFGSQTLVDVSQLERAFDAADFSEVAEAVHSATCPALGHEAACRYAHLAVADWTTQSKATTGRLAHTLVNKGLPWPTAVDRATKVVGVPLERLGRYATSAADRQANALGLLDAADRVLMEYAKYRGDMESDLVAKSGRVRHRMNEREWDESEVRRDEAGRFAVEAHAATDQEKLERAKRREARAKRRARRDRRQKATQEAPAQSPGRVPPKTADRVRENAAAPPRRPPATPPRTAARNRGPTGVLGFDLINVHDVPDYDSNSVPVTVGSPLYLIEYTNGDGELVYSPAFTDRDVYSVVEVIVGEFYPAQKSVTVHRYPPGALIVKGASRGQKRRWNQQVGFGLADEPLMPLMPDEDTAFQRRIPEPSAYRMETFFNSDMERVTVGFWNAEMVEVPVKEPQSKSWVTKSGRVRYRAAAKEPWDESEVARDQLGRFAVEENAQTDQERAARAQRRAQRRARRERRERRANAQVAAVEQQRREPAQQGRVAGRVQPRTADRVQDRVAPRERASGPEEWLAQAEDGILTDIQTPWLTDLGVSVEIQTRPLFLDELVERTREDLEASSADIPQSFAWQAMKKYELHHSYVRRDAQGNVREAWMADDTPDEATAITLLRVHSLLEGLTSKGWRGVNLQIPHSSTEDLHAELLDLAGAVMYSSGRDVRERQHSAYARELVDDDEALAITMRSGLHDDGPAVVLDKGREARMQAWSGMPKPPNRSFVVRSSRVNDQLQLLADFTTPRNTKAGAALYVKAREQIVAELGADPARTEDMDLLLRYLSKSELAVEQMPEEQLYELGREALSMYPDGPVRLDGIDVFCIR